MTLFSELTNQVHFLNDLILSDMVYEQEDYAREKLDFNKHLLAMKSWFMRISHANKKRYLMALLKDIRRAWTLSLLLKSIWNCRPKDAVMSVCQTTVWSSYDRSPMDHNRTALSVKILAQAMINDRKWFLTLDPECQALVLTELLTVSGGPIVWEVYRRASMLYEQYRDLQLKSIMDCIVVGAGSSVGARASARSSTVRQQKQLGSVDVYSSPGQLLNEPETIENYKLLYLQPTLVKTGLPSSSAGRVSKEGLRAHKELEAAQSAWNSKIKQIRDSQKLEEIEMTFNDGTKNKIWKVNRPKPEGIETVDFLQLLPGTVGKLILSFLPSATLLNYAKVNKYWAYLVDDYKAELEARNSLERNIDMLQEILLVHDTSVEMLHPALAKTGSTSQVQSVNASIRTKMNVPSFRASEKSITTGFSFKYLTEKLKLKVKKQRPIRNLRELNDRLERRGAADAHLWRWCDYLIKEGEAGHVTEKPEEGVLRFKDLHFPARLMKCHIQIPLNKPLITDPMEATSTLPKSKKNMSNTNILKPEEPEETKRYRLWSRNFSELYKVYKVPSYHVMDF